MMMIIPMLLQAAVVCAPPSSNQEEAILRARKLALGIEMPRGTIDSPARVADGMMVRPETIIGSSRHLQQLTAQDSIASVFLPLSGGLTPSCYKVAEYPTGFELSDSMKLNGMKTAFQCRNVVVSVLRRSFARPMKTATAAGIPAKHVVAILNGGALSKNFRQSVSGVRQVSYQWIGKSESLDVALTTTDASFAAMEREADRIVNDLTKHDRKVTG